MSIDLITCWPDNCDYPLWRYQITKYRHYFNKVIIVFTKTNKGHDYRDFVRQAMSDDQITFLDSPPLLPGEDWRNIATNWALKHSSASWVWFTEEDFYVADSFWQFVVNTMETTRSEVIAAYQANRMHPCSIFATRSLLDSIDLDFGIVPNVSDHFSKIQSQIEVAGVDIKVIPDDLYYHYNGLSHNWALVSSNEPAVYHDKEFIDYLRRSLAEVANIDPTWAQVASRAIAAYYKAK